MWEGFAKRKKNVHDALVSGDIGEIRSLLEAPAKHHLFYGFDSLYPESTKACLDQTEAERKGSERSLAMDIVKMAEGVGVRRVRDPKKPTEYAPSVEVDLNGLLGEIASHLNIDIKFPSPFADEFGLETAFGVASYRSINALYQAYLVTRLVPDFGRRVTEIGGGSGRTAYFAATLGVTDYTIIDVPLTNVAQAIFLGVSLGEDAVRLSGEERTDQVISIVSPMDDNDYSGVILNVDSMPEMSMPHVREYIDNIQSGSSTYLSINHEAHEAIIGHMASTKAKLYKRNFYALRPGYLEELFIYRWPRA
jgi:hypothetical protein